VQLNQEARTIEQQVAAKVSALEAGE